MIKLTNKRISNGRNVWHVTGLVKHGEVRLDLIHGDVTDVAGIREALRALIASKPQRYGRYIA